MSEFDKNLDYDSGWIEADGTCSECRTPIEIDDLKALGYVAENGGVQPGTPDGPAVHWSEGTIECPNCGERIWIMVSE